MKGDHGCTTRNTDCRDAKRDRAGFEALGRLMQGEWRKQATERRRDPGTCSCCGQTIPVAYRVFDFKSGSAEMMELRPDETERIEKMKAAVERNETVDNLPRFIAIPQYHCAILVDQWYMDFDRNKKRSPTDLGYELEEMRKRESKLAFTERQEKPKSGVERLEAMGSGRL